MEAECNACRGYNLYLLSKNKKQCVLCGRGETGGHTNVTLTKERTIEASPIPDWLKDRLLEILAGNPDMCQRTEVMVQACYPLWKWYKAETQEIGEEGAFWGLVYRLLPNPTKDDIKLLRRMVTDVDWSFYTKWGDDPPYHRWIYLKAPV
jgi:hypothetical protein